MQINRFEGATVLKKMNLSLCESARPLYLRVADSLRTAVKSGWILPGEKLPSSRVLADHLSCHRHTVMTALDELVSEGWITSRQRQGYFVSSTLPDSFFKPENGGSPMAASAPHEWRIVRKEGGLVYPACGKEIEFDFRSGLADLRLFPVREFRSCFGEALKNTHLDLLGYGHSRGEPLLLEALSTYLRRVRSINHRDILITNGSQEAIYIIGKLLLKTGDRVAVEEPGYPMAWKAFKAAGASLVPVRIDRLGMVPEHLARLAEQKRLRLIYLTPLHQFPTTATMPVDRRMKIYDIAVRYGIPVLEDDYDHEYHYRSYPLAPLASNDPAGIIIYASSFSKTVFPSIRLGFLAVPEGLSNAIERYKDITTRQQNLINQRAVAYWISGGGFERHLRRTRKTYEKRKEIMIACLEAARAKGMDLSWITPDGGMAVWLDTRRNAEDITRRALKYHVRLLHESLFRLKGQTGTHLRLGFAHLTEDEIRQGMERVFQAF